MARILQGEFGYGAVKIFVLWLIFFLWFVVSY